MQDFDRADGESDTPDEEMGELQEGQFTEEIYEDVVDGEEYDDLVEELMDGVPEEARTNDGVTYEVKGFEDTEEGMVMAKVSNEEENELAEKLLGIYAAMEQFKEELPDEEAEEYEEEILAPFRQEIIEGYA